MNGRAGRNIIVRFISILQEYIYKEILGHYNNIIEWLINNKFISQSWRLGSPRSRRKQIQYLVRVHFLFHSCLLT